MILRFIGKNTRQRQSLQKILDQIGTELHLEKGAVNSCLDSSLYQIKFNHMQNFQHMDEPDQRFFIETLTHCFETSLVKERGSNMQNDLVKELIHDAAAIALDLPKRSR